ncbi:MAG: carbohydrate ABC transporter permease [Clostridia bacterium]|nr:carbohydrate ABC transporter permease [Clostridia bacterium]
MKFKATFEDICVSVVSYLFMGILALSALIPFINIIAKATSEEWAVVSGKVTLWPIGFSLDALKYVVTSSQFLNAFSVSVFVTVAGTFLALLMTAMAAYPLSKKNLWGIKGIIVIYIFTMMFNGGLVPNYLLIRSLKLNNTLWALILPGLINVHNMLIIKNYYESLPDSIEESARIDGASNITILFKIVVPLSVPVFATIALFIAVALWNDYFGPLLYINSPNLKTLQLYLRDIVTNVADDTLQNADDAMNLPTEGVRSATIIASTVPILCVYPFLQKHFVKGILIGSVKG